MARLRRVRRFEVIAAVLIAVGIALRLVHFAARRSLWIDEARLALNVGGRSWLELTGPLWYDQAAPPLFLWATKALFALGAHEWALRAIPLTVSILSLGLFWWIAGRLVPARAALLALAVVSLSPLLIYFSNEFKPYAVDFFVTCLLLALTIRTILDPGRRYVPLLCGVGLVVPWLSSPSVFVLAGCGTALLLDPVLRTQNRFAPAATCLSWTVSGLVCYTLVLHPTAANEYLARFWEYRLLTPGPDLGMRAWAALSDLASVTIAGRAARPGINESKTFLYGMVVVITVPVGLWRLARQHPPPIAALGLVPLLLMLGAAAAGAYPVSARVSLFAAPLWLIALGSGADRLLRPSSGLFWVASAALLVVPAARDLEAAAHPLTGEHARPVIAILQANRRPDEPVYVSAGALPTWAFYSTEWKMPDRRRLQTYALVGSSGGIAFENAPSRTSVAEPRGQPGVLVTPAGPELIGRYTGQEWRWGRGPTTEQPDSGWASSEAGRVASIAGPLAWVLTAHDRGADLLLFEAIRQAGGCVDHVAGVGDARLARVTFGSAVVCALAPGDQGD